MGDLQPIKNLEVRSFHDLYRNQTETGGPPYVSYKGVNCLKCPLDLWIYQEILWELQPKYVIEGGTCSGGTTLFLADMLQVMGLNESKVISLDIDDDHHRPKHPLITYIIGDTLAEETWNLVSHLCPEQGRRVLILDDGHDYLHVFAELGLATKLLSPGDVLIVEDTNLGGPLWGLDMFLDLEHNPKLFERVPKYERLLLTFNPRGYLRCIQ